MQYWKGCYSLKDITNVQTEIHQGSDNNNLDTLVQCLKDMEGMSPLHRKVVYFFSIHPGSTVKLCTNDKNELTGLFQDCIMKATFSSNPVLLMLVSYIPSKSI